MHQGSEHIPEKTGSKDWIGILKQVTSSRKRALIVKFGAIGDVIMAIPAVRALHDQGYSIDWACGHAVQPLLESYSWISPIPVDDKAMVRGTPLERARSISSFWSRTLSHRYDLCATLYYDQRYKLLTIPVRAERKLFFSLNSRDTLLLPGRHHTDEYARVLLELPDGCREASILPVRPDLLPSAPLPAKTAPRRIAIVPGGTSNVIAQQVLRRWPVENYVSLTECLLERGWEILLLGGPEDVWVRSYFQHLKLTDCIGTMSLPEVVSACGTCDAVITHDTGPLHLAGLADTCLLGIFGPTDPATRVPRRPFAVGIWGGQGFACRPCYDGRHFAPCQFNGCMHQVTPELVIRELDRVLDDRLHGRPSPWKIVVPEVVPQSEHRGLSILS